MWEDGEGDLVSYPIRERILLFAKAGPVRGRVVGPVDLQLESVLGGDGQRQWNQVSLRCVFLATSAPAALKYRRLTERSP